MPRPSLRGAFVGIVLTAASGGAPVSAADRPAAPSAPVPTASPRAASTIAREAPSTQILPTAAFQPGMSAQARGAALRKRAVDYAKAGDFTSARAVFEQARQQTPRDCELLADYGYSLYLAGDYPAAERVLRQSLQFDANHVRSWNNLGRALAAQGRMKEGWAALIKGGDQADAFANLASVYARGKEYEKAHQAFEQALKISPENQAAIQGMARLAELTEGRFGMIIEFVDSPNDAPRPLNLDHSGAEPLSPRNESSGRKPRSADATAGGPSGAPEVVAPLELGSDEDSPAGRAPRGSGVASGATPSSDEGPRFDVPSFDAPLDLAAPPPPAPRRSTSEEVESSVARKEPPTASAETTPQPKSVASTTAKPKAATPTNEWTPVSRTPKAPVAADTVDAGAPAESEAPAASPAPKKIVSSGAIRPDVATAPSAAPSAAEPRGESNDVAPSSVAASSPAPAEAPSAAEPESPSEAADAEEAAPRTPRVIRSSEAPGAIAAREPAPATSPEPSPAPSATESPAEEAAAPESVARVAPLPQVGSALRSQLQELGAATTPREKETAPAAAPATPTANRAPEAVASATDRREPKPPRRPEMFEDVAPTPPTEDDAAPPSAAPAPIRASEPASPAEPAPSSVPNLSPVPAPSAAPTVTPEPAPSAAPAVADEAPGEASTRPTKIRSSAPPAPNPPDAATARSATRAEERPTRPTPPRPKNPETVELHVYEARLDVIHGTEDESDPPIDADDPAGSVAKTEPAPSRPAPASRPREITADRRSAETPTGTGPAPLSSESRRAEPMPSDGRPAAAAPSSDGRRAKPDSAPKSEGTPSESEAPPKRKTAAFGVRPASAEFFAPRSTGDTSRRVLGRPEGVAPQRDYVEPGYSTAADAD